MSKRRGRITTVRRGTDRGQPPNLYVGEISVEIRVFAPPHTHAEDVLATLAEAHRQASVDVGEDYP